MSTSQNDNASDLPVKCKTNKKIQTDKTENNNKNIVSQILVTCKFPDFVNINVLKEYVKKDSDGNREYFDNLNITYKISDPKKAEWILSKSIKNSKLVENGKYFSNPIATPLYRCNNKKHSRMQYILVFNHACYLYFFILNYTLLICNHLSGNGFKFCTILLVQ